MVTTTTTTFAPKGFLTKFKDRTANDIADLIVKQVALPMDATIKARNIVLSKDDAVALTSSAYSAHTFAKGVAHRLALFAGGKSLEEVQKDLPTMAQCAIVAGAAGLKMGAGLTVADLRNALSVGIAHVMALPVKTKPKEAPAKVAVSTFDAVSHALPLALIIENADKRDTREPLPHSLTDGERTMAHQALVDVPRAIAEAEAKAKAEAEAKAKAEEEAKAEAMRAVFDQMTARGETLRKRAQAFAQLANDLGIKLTKSQLAALDALEAEKIPA
jgi:hypothetical protein